MDSTTPPAEAVPPDSASDTSKKRGRSGSPQTPASATRSPAPPTPASKKRKLSEDPNNIAKSATPPASETHSQLGFALNGPAVARVPPFVPAADGLPYFTTADVPMNRQGFRYTPAGPSPPGCILSHRTVESQPAGYVRVSWEDRSPYLRVSTDGLGLMGEKGFRSARLNVPVKEGKWYLEIKIEKAGGEGAQPPTKDGAHVRLGWGRREAPLNGPAGMDGYSYAFRDKTGEKCTLSRTKQYGRPFGSGDVIGLYISLPPRRKPIPNDPADPARVVRKRIAINYKNQLYFESMDYAQSKEMMALMDMKKPSAAPSKKDASMKDSQTDNKSAASRRRKAKPIPVPEAPTLRSIPTLGPTSCIAFFVNGECQGPAFTDLYDYLQMKPLSKKDVRGRRNLPAHLRERENPFDDGSLGYYPFLSLFNDARVSINAGPDFQHPPPSDIDAALFPNSHPTSPDQATPTQSWRALSERYAEYMAEEFAQDELDEIEARKTTASSVPVVGLALDGPGDARSAPSKKKADSSKKSSGKKGASKAKRSALGTEVFTAEDLLDQTTSRASDSVEPGNGDFSSALNAFQHGEDSMNNADGFERRTAEVRRRSPFNLAITDLIYPSGYSGD